MRGEQANQYTSDPSSSVSPTVTGVRTSGDPTAACSRARITGDPKQVPERLQR
jgi:hypothetical protein